MPKSQLIEPARTNLFPIRTALIYFIFSALWIFLSDSILALIFPDINTFAFWQTIKGLFFISVTTLLIYFLIRKDLNQLHIQKSLLQDLIETSPVGIALTDNIGQITFANKEAEKVLGLEKKLITSRNYNAPEWKITAVDGSQFPEEELPFVKVKNTHKSIRDVQHAIEYPDGRKTILSINASPRFDKHNNFDGMIASIENITLLKKHEEELEKSKQQVEEILNRISDSFVALDKKWCYTYVNDKAASAFGKTKDEMLGKNIWTLFPEGVGKPFHLAYEKAMREQEFIFLEDYYSPYDKWFENRIYPSENGLSIFFQDITERKKAEDNLKESEFRFRKIFEDGATGMVMAGKDFKFRVVNRTFCQMTDYSEDELLQLTFAQITHPDDITKDIENVKKMLSGEVDVYRTEKRYLKKDGQTFWAQLTVSPIYDQNKLFLYFVGIIIDITERKKAEELVLDQLNELQRWQKVMIGREERNLELKHEVNELLGELGKQKKYSV